MNDYILSMRKIIGKEMLMTIGCGIILEDTYGRILLQRRKDQNNWCIPGGVMEIGETFVETAIRETFEETNLTAHDLKLFGIFSGTKYIKEYPNGDKVYSVQVIFHTLDFEGTLKNGKESFEHQFFSRDNLPQPLNPNQAPFILDWADGKDNEVIVE